MDKKEYKSIILSHYQDDPNVKGVKVTGNADCYVAKIDFGSFCQCVLMQPQSRYQSYERVSLSYSFSGYKNIVSIYDLLSFIGVDDYNVYTHKGLLGTDSLNKLLDTYDALTDQYYSYLESISTDADVQDRMTDHLIKGTCVDRFSDDPNYDALKKEAISDLTDIELSMFSAPTYVHKNNGKRSKSSVINALEKKRDLLDVYELRALDYFKSGGKMPKPQKSSSSYTSYVLKMLGVALAISLVPLAVNAAIIAITYGSGYVPFVAIKMSIVIGVLGLIALFAGVIFLFGRLLLRLVTPRDVRKNVVDRFSAELENRADYDSDKWYSRIGRILYKLFVIAAGIFGLVVGLAFSVFGTDCMAFYDDYVKFSSNNGVVSVQYSDLDIYAIAPEDEDDLYGDYAFVHNEDEYVILYDVEPDSTADKYIVARANDNNIEIKNVKSVGDIKELANEDFGN